MATQTALKIVDETPTGEVVQTMTLRLVSERINVRELIERRVREEVNRFHQERSGLFRGLVQPSDTEAELNGYRLRKPRQLDPEEQCREAIRAFEQNGFFLLVDDRQVESLEEDIIVHDGLKVSFIKLVPLVGG